VNADFIRALTTAAYTPALKGSNFIIFCLSVGVVIKAALVVWGP